MKINIGTPALLTIIVVVLIASGALYYNTRTQGDSMMTDGEKMMEEGEAMMEENDAMMEEGEAMMEEGDVMMEEGEAMMEEGSMMDSAYTGERLAGSHDIPLLDFTKEDYEKAVANEKLVVLYFYANWCPVCKVEFPKMQSVFNSLDTEGVVGFRVNYNDNQTDDAEKQLARDFGVAYQHSKVFIKNGERILKSPEGWDENRYIEEITNAVK